MSQIKGSAHSTQGQDSYTDISADKEMVFKTIESKKYFINEYVKDWSKLILDNSTMIEVVIRGNILLKVNDFLINPYILNNYSVEYLVSITKKLDTVFPVSENEKLHDFLYKVQFHSRDYNPTIINGVNNLSPNVMNVSDYAIFQMEDNIIVFHLDIQTGIGKTISSIFPSKYLKKQFTHTIEVPYIDTLSEEEEQEALVEAYQNSSEYEEKSLKEAENQADLDAEQNNNEAISHPDYPEDYS